MKKVYFLSNLELTTNLKALEEKLGDLDKHKDTLMIENNGGADDNNDIVKVGEDISEIRMPENNKEERVAEMNKLLESQQDKINELTKSYNNERYELAGHYEQERKKYEEKINNMRQSVQEVKNKLETDLAKRNELMQGTSKQLEE
jgi:hypothetical protein